MNQAHQYLSRYQQAETLQEKGAVVGEYQTYLKTLTPEERMQARKVMSVLWPGIKERINTTETMLLTLNKRLDELVSQPNTTPD